MATMKNSKESSNAESPSRADFAGVISQKRGSCGSLVPGDAGS